MTIDFPVYPGRYLVSKEPLKLPPIIGEEESLNDEQLADFHTDAPQHNRSHSTTVPKHNQSLYETAQHNRSHSEAVQPHLSDGEFGTIMKERSSSENSIVGASSTKVVRDRKISAPPSQSPSYIEESVEKNKGTNKFWNRKGKCDDGEIVGSEATTITVNDTRTRKTTTTRRERKISTGKMIKNSVTQGFSKFKQLSLGGYHQNENKDHSYSLIDEDTLHHETSKRTKHPDNPIGDEQGRDREGKGMEGGEGKETLDTPRTKGRGTLMRRSSSLPNCFESGSEGSCEDLNDLYLPRRMAICPDLPVEAMKQLRTYLVLTRLKQYCIV